MAFDALRLMLVANTASLENSKVCSRQPVSLLLVAFSIAQKNLFVTQMQTTFTCVNNRVITSFKYMVCDGGKSRVILFRC